MKNTSTIRNVKVSYVGSESDFQDFLISVIRDKLNKPHIVEVIIHTSPV